eukprot:gnl/MRDRNA2_/MRDRNA2_34331_c0_seq1.p1 gnl/MRDRNA2_/MRDRNA2_34331_c0~~gnl/MRDRNA2_/MRDRNA2_34331_c0_seq1.p1  ORF type:complete len:575 (+),score=55.76 gnl/MRDRNA2_/MRDRNA2_34331_c0_seq1:118-1842(+)
MQHKAQLGDTPKLDSKVSSFHSWSPHEVTHGPREPSRFRAIRWIYSLGDYYGYRFLWMLFCSQCLLKGFCVAYVSSASDFVFRSYHVSGPTLQVYKAVSTLPWCFKPVMGVLSDNFPIFGYNKRFYILIVSALGTLGFCAMGLGHQMKLPYVVAAMTLISMQISTCDLLTEAKYAEKLREKPDRGPELMSLLHGGMTISALCAHSTIGFVIQHLGPRAAYAICIPLSLFIVAPTLANFLQEVPYERSNPSKSGKNRELIVIAVFIGFCCVMLAYAGMELNVTEKFHLAISIAVMLVSVMSFFMRPEISCVVVFFFIRQVMHPSISGATFYFFTDSKEEYPQGPHFSTFFYTTVMGLAGGVCTLLGIAAYARWGKNFRYVKLMVCCNVIFFFAGILQLLVYTRYNLVLGIPDRIFMLGETLIHNCLGQWLWIPGTVLLSQCCPKGLEATMYALLAGAINLGETLASYNGAYMLHRYHVNPDGRVGEGNTFSNMWQPSLTTTCLSLVTTCMLPLFIPNATQTERLIRTEESSAIAGSPWDRWFLTPFGGGTQKRMDDDSAAEAASSDAPKYGATQC